MAAPHFKYKQKKSHQKQETWMKNPKRLVTIQYDAGFLLFQLQYSADHEDWETVENATSWSHKASNSPFCIEVQLQLVILKCHRKHNKSIKPGEKQGSFLNWSPSIPSLPTYSKFPTPISHIRHLKLISQWKNVVGSIFKTTRLNQDLDTKLKVQNERTESNKY